MMSTPVGSRNVKHMCLLLDFLWRLKILDHEQWTNAHQNKWGHPYIKHAL
jgi:hypothetical protein